MGGPYKLREEWESRYVSEFVEEMYPDKLKKIRVPLGPLTAEDIATYGLEAAARRMRAWRPEVDAIVITETGMILIEGKIIKVMDGFSKLPVYGALAKITPDLDKYNKNPIRLMLVTPKPPTWALSVAPNFDVEIEIYRPDWLKDYYTRQERYWTPEGRLDREKRKAAMREIGLD
jgi:hypothetical protein